MSRIKKHKGKHFNVYSVKGLPEYEPGVPQFFPDKLDAKIEWMKYQRQRKK